jgi:hypothetical protein
LTVQKSLLENKNNVKTENVKNEPVNISDPSTDLLGGTATGTLGGGGGGVTDTKPGTGTGTDPDTNGTATTNTDGNIPTRATGGGFGDGEGQTANGTSGSEPGDRPATQPATGTRRARKPRTATVAATGTDTTDEKPTQTVLELAAPVSINLNTGRRSKAKSLAIKPESVADALVLGFGVLEKQRGPHWKRTKAECEPFAKSVSALIPDLPPELLKTLEKSAPWVSLAVTGTMLFLPSILAELNIAKMRAELAELERKNGIKSTPTTPGTNPNGGTMQSSGNPASPSSGTGSGSTSERSADGGPDAKDDTIVPAFGKFGNVAL